MSDDACRAQGGKRSARRGREEAAGALRHGRPGARHAKTSRELRACVRPQFSRALRRFRCDRQGRKRLQGVLSEVAGKDTGQLYAGSHRGQLRVRSAGAAAPVRAPRQRSQPRSRCPHPVERVRLRCRAAMKILVVDDSPTIRAALKGLLERMGHTVVEANDGEQALHLYRQDRPGLVLIDVVMPIMDGYESARHMRETKADEWVPIIFLSSKEADQDLDRAIEAGGDDYLVKPVSFVVLNAKIRALQRLESMRTKQLEMSRDLASANRELEKLSRQDGLTGIANRRYFDSYLVTGVRRGARDHQTL